MGFFGLISELINITYLQNRNRKIPSPVTSEDDEAETTISSDEFAATIPNEVTSNIFEDYRSGKETNSGTVLEIANYATGTNDRQTFNGTVIGNESLVDILNLHTSNLSFTRIAVGTGTNGFPSYFCSFACCID